MVRAAAASGFPLLDLSVAMLILVVLVVWCWLLFLILGDLVRRDCSGWAKAAWTVVLVVFPYVGVLAYLVTQGRGMVERRREEETAARTRSEHDARTVANGRPAPAPVEQIAAAKQLLDTGAITPEEYELLKQRAIGRSVPGVGASRGGAR